MRTFVEVRPAELALSEEEIVRDYLAKRGFVAIRRDLANELAKSDGGPGSHLMAYDPEDDRYVWRVAVKTGAVNG